MHIKPAAGQADSCFNLTPNRAHLGVHLGNIGEETNLGDCQAQSKERYNRDYNLMIRPLGKGAVVNRFGVALVLALSSVPCSVQAQGQSSQAGPAYFGVIEAVVDGHRVSLERLTGIIAASTRSRLIGGTKAGWDFEGRSSPIRIRQGQTFFLVAQFAAGVDPYSMFKMSRMEQSRTSRVVPIMRTGSVLQKRGPVRPSEHSIPLNFEPYRGQFVKIQPANPLNPGEYVIFFGAVGPTGFGLGID